MQEGFLLSSLNVPQNGCYGLHLAYQDTHRNLYQTENEEISTLLVLTCDEGMRSLLSKLSKWEKLDDLNLNFRN